MEGEIQERLLRWFSREKASKPKNHVWIICPYIRCDRHSIEQELKQRRASESWSPNLGTAFLPERCCQVSQQQQKTIAYQFLAVAEVDELEIKSKVYKGLGFRC